MKTRLLILLAALALAGCATNRGGTGAGYDTDQDASEQPYPPTDFGRGGNRANPPFSSTESGAMLPETDNLDLHGMQPDKFPPPTTQP